MPTNYNPNGYDYLPKDPVGVIAKGGPYYDSPKRQDDTYDDWPVEQFKKRILHTGKATKISCTKCPDLEKQNKELKAQIEQLKVELAAEKAKGLPKVNKDEKDRFELLEVD